jgi:hypothetical protein
VQNCRAMQSSRSIQQAIEETQISSSARLPDLRKTSFRKPGKPRIALTDYRAKITTRRITFRMECVGKTCCAAIYRVPLPAGISLPAFRFRTVALLELAKGFEPPTL